MGGMQAAPQSNMLESDAAVELKLTGDKLSYVPHRKSQLTSLMIINGRRVVFGGTPAQ